MAGRFRFTPTCQCECGGDTCVPPCIPECREIFRGCRSDSSFTITNIQNYNDFSGRDCSYFTVGQPSTDAETGKTVYRAVPSASKTNDNHILACIALTAHAASAERYECGSAPIPYRGIAALGTYEETDTQTDAPAASVSGVSLLGYGSSATVEYGHSFTVPATVPEYAWYDTRYHNATGDITWTRLICLPFDNRTEPIRFCDGAGEELRPVDDKQEYYVPLSGSSLWDCSFSYPRTCGMGGDVSATTLFNANELGEKIDDIVNSANRQLAGRIESWLTPGLDFIVVRLFGWATCPLNRYPCISYDAAGAQHISATDFICPPVCPNWPSYEVERNFKAEDVLPVSLEFQIGFLQRSNRLYEAIVNADVSTASLAWDWSDTGDLTLDDCPREIQDFARSQDTGTQVNARVVFGSADTSALAASNSVGDANTMPTNWRRSRGSRYGYRSECDDYSPNEATGNGERFHGVYWSMAAISRCGTDFPETVTGGHLSWVPVAHFKLDTSVEHDTPFGPQYDFTFQSGSDAFSYADMTREFWYWTGQGEYTWKESLDNVLRQERVRPYIIKPQGKYLKRLIWRVFREPLIYSPYRNPPTYTADDLHTYVRPFSLEIGRLSDPQTEFERTHDLEMTASHVRYDCSDAGLPIVSDDCRPGFESRGGFEDGLFSQYVRDHNFSLFEQSVNGDTFKEFVDPATGVHYYFPTMNSDKLKLWFGREPSSMTRMYAKSYSESFFQPDFDVYFYTSRLTYLAVWGDEGGQ